MVQPYYGTKINCQEQEKDEIGVILEVDSNYFFYVFLSFLMFTLNLINLKT